MTNARAEAFAPATVANLGVGFDLMGLAVEGSGDTIIAEWCTEPGAVIADITGDDGKLPREADQNVASVAAAALLEQVGATHGVRLYLHKGLPGGSGIGSSAASAVAAVVAVNALLENPLPREDLLLASLKGEAIASKGMHADNIAPCLLGGITLTIGADISRIRHLPVPDDLYLAIVTPAITVKTADARAALPDCIPMAQVVNQTGAVAELVDALYRNDIPAMAQAMEADCIIEPARQHLMPYLQEVRTAAKNAGAYGLVISGAGPSLCAICDSKDTAQTVAQTMQIVYKNHHIESQIRAGSVLKTGATITTGPDV